MLPVELVPMGPAMGGGGQEYGGGGTPIRIGVIREGGGKFICGGYWIGFITIDLSLESGARVSIPCAMIGTVYPNIPLSSASIHGQPRSSLGATLRVRMSVTAYRNSSTMSSAMANRRLQA